MEKNEELYLRQYIAMRKMGRIILTHNELKRIENVISSAETRVRTNHEMEHFEEEAERRQQARLHEKLNKGEAANIPTAYEAYTGQSLAGYMLERQQELFREGGKDNG